MDRRQMFKADRSLFNSRNTKSKVLNKCRSEKRCTIFNSRRDLSPISPEPKEKENFPARPNVQPSNVVDKQSKKKEYLLRYLAWKAEKDNKAKKKWVSGKALPAVAVKPTSEAPFKMPLCPKIQFKFSDIQEVGKSIFQIQNGKQVMKFNLSSPLKKTSNQINISANIKSSAQLVPKHPHTIEFKSITHEVGKSEAITKQKSQSKVTQQKIVRPTKTKLAPLTMVTRSAVHKLELIASSLSDGRDCKTTTTEKNAVTLRDLSVMAKKTLAPNTRMNALKPKPLADSLSIVKNVKARIPGKNTRALKNPSLIARKDPNPHARILTAEPKDFKDNLPSLRKPVFKVNKKVKPSISKACGKINTTEALNTIGHLIQKPVDLVQTTAGVVKVTVANQNDIAPSKLSKSNHLKPPASSSPYVSVKFHSEEISNENGINGKRFNFVHHIETEEEDNDCKEDLDTSRTSKLSMSFKKLKSKSPEIPPNFKPYNTKLNGLDITSNNPGPSPNFKNSARKNNILKTVRFHRQHLAEEIARLRGISATWEVYKDEHAGDITESGEDTINSAIGQTNLFITKKLKQFSDLIDRCEEGANGIQRQGDSEDARPILPEDLEGFWSMVSLQIDNIEKRFADLERWKSNNWEDPDEVPKDLTLPKIKKTKKQKSVVGGRPAGGLVKMLRAANAALLRKKAETVDDGVVVLTPSLKKHVLIKDRLSVSPATTIITINKSGIPSAIKGTPAQRRLAACRASSNTPSSIIKKRVRASFRFTVDEPLDDEIDSPNKV